MRYLKTKRKQSGAATTRVDGWQQRSLLTADEVKPYRKARRPRPQRQEEQDV